MKDSKNVEVSAVATPRFEHIHVVAASAAAVLAVFIALCALVMQSTNASQKALEKSEMCLQLGQANQSVIRTTLAKLQSDCTQLEERITALEKAKEEVPSKGIKGLLASLWK